MIETDKVTTKRSIINQQLFSEAVLATWHIRSQKTTSFSDGCTK